MILNVVFKTDEYKPQNSTQISVLMNKMLSTNQNKPHIPIIFIAILNKKNLT